MAMSSKTMTMRANGAVRGSCSARPGAPVLRRALIQQHATYTSPSSSTGASELEWVGRVSTLVPDSIDATAKRNAASVSYGLLKRAATAEILGLSPIENAIAAARTFDPKHPERQVDRALANVAALLAQQVEGRVSIEVDPRLANDKSALVSKAKGLLAMCQDVGLSPSKLLLRLPATWAGISAAAELEQAGVDTHVDLVHSVIQAVAAGQAGVSLVNVRVGRTRDFYSKHPGLVRDPSGPRQDAGALGTGSAAGGGVDPGVKLAQDVYNYLKVHHPKTQVMASSVRTREDVLALAGVDFILCPNKVLQALASTQTTEGYNSGLSASNEDEGAGGLQPALSVQGAKAAAPAARPKVTEASFTEGLGYAGKELLAQALHEAVQDVDALASLARVTTGLSSS